MRLLLILMCLLFASQAQAQAEAPVDPPLELLEAAAAICIGPGIEVGPEDPYAVLRDLPQKNCLKACKEAVKGCLKLVKVLNSCGVVYLKTIEKIAAPVCKGLGGSAAECKAIKPVIRSEIDSWLNGNEAEVLECIIGGAECSEVCQ